MKSALTIFSEKQKFTQWWIWLILIVSYGFSFYAMNEANPDFEPIWSKLFQNPKFIIFAILMVVTLLLFKIIYLKTEITKHEITIHFSPFTKRKFAWSDIEKARVLNYGFIGGWGIRLWTKFGTAYNIKGSIGLAIELKNGKKYLIGTQKGDLMKTSIEGLIS